MARERQERIAEELLLESYLSLQRLLESTKRMPRREPTRLERHAPWLEIVGGIELGLVTAGLAVCLNIVILNLILHVQ